MTTLQTNYGNASHVGLVRSENQDYFGSFDTSLGDVFVVCDGMGGARGGSIASHLAVNSIAEFASKASVKDPEAFLKKAVAVANRVILEQSRANPKLAGMGTTCVILLLTTETDQPRAWIANVGDSRLYRQREEQLEQLTRDHSRVQDLVDGGIISEQEAEEHNARNIITRALGTAESVKPDISSCRIQAGDRFILTTDGVHGMVPKTRLQSLAAVEDAQKCASALVAAANEHGGEDNSTAMVVDIYLPEASSKARRRNLLLILVTAAVLILLAVVVLPSVLSPEDDYEREVELTADTLPTLPADTAVTEGTVLGSDTLEIEVIPGVPYRESFNINQDDPRFVLGLHAESAYLYTMRVDETSSPADIRLLSNEHGLDSIVPGGFLNQWEPPGDGRYILAISNAVSATGSVVFVCETKPKPVVTALTPVVVSEPREPEGREDSSATESGRTSSFGLNDLYQRPGN